LKNATDWASPPYGTNSFTGKPSAVIGTSPGAIGTAVAQQNLRNVLGFCNAPQMNAPEAYTQFKPGLITNDGEVSKTAPSTSSGPSYRISTASSQGSSQHCRRTPDAGFRKELSRIERFAARFGPTSADMMALSGLAMLVA
jgi:hypothetical protein